MTCLLRSANQLVNDVLDGGLFFVASYLEEILNRSIIIMDPNGIVHYPEKIDEQVMFNDLFNCISVCSVNEIYHYLEADEKLVFPISYNDTFAYIIITNLPRKLVASTISILNEAKLAIKCHFSTMSNSHKTSANFEKEMAKYLFSNSNSNFKNIIKLSDKELDMNSPFYALITEIHEVNNRVDLNRINIYSKQYLSNINIDTISFAHSNYLIAIIPARWRIDYLKIDPEWSQLEKYKESIEKHFHIVVSQGKGRTYPLSELKESFKEARIALTFPKLIGKNNLAQQFTDLGVYALLFSQDIETLNTFCIKTLGKLIKYDESTKGELLNTLRHLVDNNFAVKTTADNMFVHANTIYYRINKIEELLNVEITKVDTQLELYSAITIWDTCNLNGFWDYDVTAILDKSQHFLARNS